MPPLDFAKNVKLIDQKDTIHSKSNSGFRTTNKKLKPSPTWASTAAINMENRVLQPKQRMFPITKAIIFRFNGPPNGKNMHTKKMLKANST